MNRITLGRLALCSLLTASWAAAADDGTEALRDECRTVAEGHGVTAEQMDSWIQRCIENTGKIRKEMKREEQTKEAAPEQGHGH